MNDQKLTEEEFISQLGTLISKAPEDMVYVINATSDPEKKKGKQIIACAGKKIQLNFLMNVAFDHCPDLKNLISDSLRMHSVRKPKDGLEAILEQMKGSFPQEELFEAIINIMKEREPRKNSYNSSFGPGH